MAWQHFRYAVRSLVARPGFTAVALGTLALGIGANTAIFTIVNAVLLRPLPYPGAERIVRLRGSSVGSSQPDNLSPMDFLDLRERARRFDHLAAYNNYAGATLTGVGEPERVVGTRVTADFLSVLSSAPLLGRDFRSDDDQPGASPVAILAYGFWQRRFANDSSIVGRTIDLNSVPTEVIGVLSPAFRHPFPENAQQPDVFVPFRIDRKENNRGGHYLQAIGRLSGGASLADGQADLSSIASDLAHDYPNTNTGHGVRIAPLIDAMVGGTRTPLFILLGTVALVLLIACANLANLLLARSTSRRKEIAVRQALGATRLQLVGQLLAESVVLAGAGGMVGLVVAEWAMRGLVVLGASGVPRGDTISLDGRVLLFAIVLSLATGLLFGVGPALYSTRLDAQHALNVGGRSGDGHLHLRAQQTLIVSEIALTLMLLVAAGLLVTSFWRLEHVDPGFRAGGVLTLQTSLPLARYAEGDEMPFYQRLEDRIRPLPGVAHVGAVNILPLGGSYSCDGFDVEGRQAELGKQPCAEARSITPDYFAAMGIPLVRGRGFTRQDGEGAGPVVIINEKMASTFWPERDPIGSRIVRNGVARQVVGIVGGVKHFGLDRDVTPEMYTPHTQQPSYHTMTLVIRTPLDPVSLVPTIRRELSMLDRDVPISNVKSMNDMVADSTSQPRFRTLLVGAFAALAVVLSVVGVSGVIGYAVGRRTHEIGVRVALGATRRQVIALLVTQGVVPAAVGLVVGLAGAAALTRVLQGLLFGVAPTDLRVYSAATALLAIAAVAATYVPARRATSIDPMIALRAE
jgi:putative ABC transport system permease protein